MWTEELEQRAAEMRARNEIINRIVCPPCPTCGGETDRKGRTKPGRPYYFRCVRCKENFKGPRVKFQRGFKNYGLMCYHCGSTNVRNKAPRTTGGRQGYCLSCRRYFDQGGPLDMKHYHLVLEMRVKCLGLPSDVAAELLQMASVDVLEGKGYTWNVELRVKDAFMAARGEYGLGSDHPMYRLQNGQRVSQGDRY